MDMSGGGTKNTSTRLLPPIKNPLFNPNEDSDEVRVTSVVGLFLHISVSVSWSYFSDDILTNTRMCLLQNSHPDRPRPGRRLGGLANLFSSRHRNSFSPNSAREDLDEANENAESSKTGTSTNLSATKPSPLSSHVEKRGTAVTPEATKPDTGSGAVKTVNSRVLSAQNRFSRNLSNNKTEAITNDVNNKEQDLPSDNEKSQRFPSSKQGSSSAISQQKRTTGLLRRDKEKRTLPVKQDSADGDKFLSANPQHERLRASSSCPNSSVSDSEMVVRRSSSSRRDEKKKSERIRYLDAMSLR